jgi:hypothetical protein
MVTCRALALSLWILAPGWRFLVVKKATSACSTVVIHIVEAGAILFCEGKSASDFCFGRTQGRRGPSQTASGRARSRVCWVACNLATVHVCHEAAKGSSGFSSAVEGCTSCASRSSTAPNMTEFCHAGRNDGHALPANSSFVA